MICLLTVTGISCGGGSIKRYKPQAKHAKVDLLVWIDPGSGLLEKIILKGCEEWKSKGVTCIRVQDRSNSDIQIYGSDKACEQSKKKARTLARARKGGKIVFYKKCYLRGNKHDDRMLHSVAVHEIGHHLGIWKHIPEKCDGKHKLHPSGKKICGKAVMNAMYDKKIYFVTPIDSLAFDVRDRLVGVVTDEVKSRVVDNEPNCVYYGK